MVSHIDQPRREYGNDGITIVRSARDWASTLCLPGSDTPALCDIVNGTAGDRKTYLVVPRHFQEEAKIQLKLYKTRLSPPSRREARYRDSLPGLA